MENRSVELLRLILPLAKGYARGHDFGSNREYVKEAEYFLEALDSLKQPAPSLPEKVGHEPDTVSAVFDLETAHNDLIDYLAALTARIEKLEAKS